jgi:dipeptidyl aminopeptidase/acylaminoacyl peptidase
MPIPTQRALLALLVMSGSVSCGADRLTGGDSAEPIAQPTTPSTNPSMPTTPWAPSFPAASSGAVVYNRTPASTINGGQRFLLFADSTFRLEFVTRRQGSVGQSSFAYPGVFSRVDSVLSFDFRNTTPWTATAVLHHDSLVVEFNDHMRLSNFEDGVYVQAPQLPKSTGGRIAFSAWNGSNRVIYTMDPDGSHLAVIGIGYDPSLSPDGKRLAYWSRSAPDSGSMYIASADGSGPTTRLATRGYQPTWSPDGQKLAYGCGGICIVNLDGTEPTRITPAAPVSQNHDVCIRDSDPAWSPDGSTIAFSRWPDAHIPESMCLTLGVALDFPFDFSTQVWLIDADGSNLRPLRNDGEIIWGYLGWPSWSPDGSRLAFYHLDEIDVVSVDRSGLVTAIRQDPVNWNALLGSPAWSPDGSEIVFGTPGGWGFAESSGSGRILEFTLPKGIVPNPFSWSWAPLPSK